jgi:hypothetical protein
MVVYDAAAEHPISEIVYRARELVALFRRHCPVDSEPGTSSEKWADLFGEGPSAGAGIHSVGSALEEFDVLHWFLWTDPRSRLTGSPDQAIADIYAIYTNKSVAIRTAMFTMHEVFYHKIWPRVQESIKNPFRATLPTFSSSDLGLLLAAANHLAEVAGLDTEQNPLGVETEPEADAEQPRRRPRTLTMTITIPSPMRSTDSP